MHIMQCIIVPDSNFGKHHFYHFNDRIPLQNMQQLECRKTKYYKINTIQYVQYQMDYMNPTENSNQFYFTYIFI